MQQTQQQRRIGLLKSKTPSVLAAIKPDNVLEQCAQTMCSGNGSLLPDFAHNQWQAREIPSSRKHHVSRLDLVFGFDAGLG